MSERIGRDLRTVMPRICKRGVRTAFLKYMQHRRLLSAQPTLFSKEFHPKLPLLIESSTVRIYQLDRLEWLEWHAVVFQKSFIKNCCLFFSKSLLVVHHFSFSLLMFPLPEVSPVTSGLRTVSVLCVSTGWWVRCSCTAKSSMKAREASLEILR